MSKKEIDEEVIDAAVDTMVCTYAGSLLRMAAFMDKCAEALANGHINEAMQAMIQQSKVIRDWCDDAGFELAEDEAEAEAEIGCDPSLEVN